MAAPAAVLQILVTANSAQAVAGLRSVDAQAKRTAATTNTATSRMSRSFSTMASVAKTALVGGVAYGLYSGVKAGVEFEKQMDAVGAVADASAKQMRKLENQALRLGQKTAFSASEAAQAQEELAKGGLKASDILGGALKASLSLAAAGQMELSDAAATTTNAMKLFELRARDAGAVADMLATAANKTTADVSDFAMALQQGGSAAKAAGYDLNQTMVILEALAEAGIKNSDAGTSMKTAFLQLLAPTEKQLSLTKQLGIEWVDQNGNLKTAAGLSKELQGALGGMTNAQQAANLKVLAGTDGFRTLNALLDAGPEKLRELAKANAEQGTAQEIAKEKLDNTAGSLEQLRGAWETLSISLFKKAESPFRSVIDSMTRGVQKLTDVVTDKKLTSDEKISKLMQMMSDAIAAAIPKIAGVGAKIGAAILKGVADAFIHGSILTKLFIGAAALRLFGGSGVFGALGGRIASKIGGGIKARFGVIGPTLMTAILTAGAAGLSEKNLTKSLWPKVIDKVMFLKQLAEIEHLGKQSLYRMVQDWQASGMRINKATVYMWQRQGKITALGAVHLLAVIERMQKNTRVAFDKLADQARRAGDAVRGFANKAGNWLLDLSREGGDSVRDLGQVLRGPLEKALDRASDDVRDFTGKAIDALDKLYDKGGKSTEDLSAKVKKMASKVGASMMGVAQVVTHGLDIIVTNTNKALQGFGVKKVAISLTHVGDVAKGFQAGGVIVPGQGSGDKVPAMLEPGEVVLNREAVAAMGGAERANSINRKIPRFAKGGKVSGSMAAMIGLVNKYERASYPYLWGGGHGGFPNGSSPVDCSGFVSDVLHAGGLLSGAPMVSGALMSWGKPASGNEPLVVYANPGHTVMSLNGRVAGTSGSNPGGGAGWIEGGNGASLAPGAKRTMDVAGAAAAIAEKIARIILKGPDGPLKDMGQAALDKARNAANKYIASKMPSGAPGGGNIGDTIAKTMTGTATWYGPLTSQLGAPVSGGGGLLSGNENAFAELGRGTSVGTALGSLPMGTWIKATILGHTANLEKRDVGQGGASTDLVDVWEDSLVNFPGLREAGRAKIKVEPTHKQTGGIIQRLAKGGLVEDLKKVLDVTRKSENDKRRKRVMKDYLKNLKGIGLNDNLSKALKALDEQQAMYGEYAGYAESLAEDGIDRFKGKTQAEWLQQQLNTLFRLRNKLVRAEKVIHRRQREIAKLLTYAEKQQKAIKKAVRLADREKDDLQKQIDREKKEKKPNRELIKHLEKRVGSIDERQKMRNAGLAALKDKIIPAVKAKKTGLAELYTTHRDRLAEVQGPGMPLEHLKSAPYGQLGGEILAVQQQIRGIGGDSTARDSDRLEIIEDLLRQSQQRLAVSQSQYRIFSATPVLGAFAKGGTAMATGSYLVGERGPEVVHLRTGDTVSPNASSFSPSVNVAVTLYEDRDKALVDVNGKEFVAAVKRVNRGQARSGGRVLPGRAGS